MRGSRICSTRVLCNARLVNHWARAPASVCCGSTTKGFSRSDDPCALTRSHPDSRGEEHAQIRNCVRCAINSLVIEEVEGSGGSGETSRIAARVAFSGPLCDLGVTKTRRQELDLSALVDFCMAHDSSKPNPQALRTALPDSRRPHWGRLEQGRTSGPAHPFVSGAADLARCICSS